MEINMADIKTIIYTLIFGYHHLWYLSALTITLCVLCVLEYIPTAKNRMVKDFYPGLGFEKLSENKYAYDLTKEYNKKIRIKEN